MNTSDFEARAQLLDEVAAGLRSADDPEILALAMSDPEFGVELANARHTRVELARAGEERREVLAALQTQEAAPGEELIAGLVHEALGGGRSIKVQAPISPARKTHLVGKLVAGLAAAVLLAWFTLSPMNGQQDPGVIPPTRLVLGDQKDSIQVVLGSDGPDAEKFSLLWKHPSFGADRTYRVVLHKGHGSERIVLFQTQRLPEKSWTPDQKELELLRDCDALSVDSIGIDGAPIYEEASALVSRSQLAPYLPSSL